MENIRNETENNVRRLTRHSGNPSLRPFIFVTDRGGDRESLVRVLDNCVEAGVGGIIPQPLVDDEDGADIEAEVRRFREFYAMLLPECARLGIRVAFSIASVVRKYIIANEYDRWETNLRARRIDRRIHYCMSDTDVTVPLCGDETSRLSLVAYNADRDEIIDLRGKEEGDSLSWHTPRGNWEVIEYICVPDFDGDRVNLLSAEASGEFLETAYALFADLIGPYLGTTVTHVYLRSIAFGTKNRHDWSPDFNEVFRARWGFDPAPYYPYLFTYAGARATHMKALFSDCRARMLRDGFLLAAEKFAEERGLDLFCSVAEPKLTECAPVTGDALLDNTASPCAVFDRSYLYGMNSVKLAAGAAFGRSIRDIFVELYRNYPDYSAELLLRDACHAFSRGANLPALHLQAQTEEKAQKMKRLFSFIASVRNCLSRGRQVSDIAVIYPIYFLHSAVNLYDAEVSGFEYPDTPYEADYMSVINSLCVYSGHDVTLLHPDVVARSAVPEGGLLRLHGLSDEGGFRVVVLPAQKVCSLACMRVLRDYFDAGGKIVATGTLPSLALEYDPADPDAGDREMRAIVDHIFGADADNPEVMREYCHNVGKNGGEAYFLDFSVTAADGTSMVASRTIHNALRSLGVCFDVYAPQMPHYESTGALNSPYNEFTRLGLQRHLPDGGMFSHIHKRHGLYDIYFFSNTTDRAAETPVFLRGAHVPYLYCPLGERSWTPDYEYVLIGGSVYTRFELRLDRSQAVIVLSDNAEEREASLDRAALRDASADVGQNRKK